MKANFQNCLAPNGQIMVNDYLQITTADPTINVVSPAAKENIFALGDCNFTSL